MYKIYTINKMMFANAHAFHYERTAFMKTYFSLKKILNPSGTNQQNTDTTPSALTPRELLLSDIEKTQHALEIAYSGFDNVTDPDLIDCYIYEIDSALKRYRFLLQQAERMQLYEQYTSCDSFDAYDDYADDTLPTIPAMPYNLSLYHN